jgi:hypothetical protein
MNRNLLVIVAASLLTGACAYDGPTMPSPVTTVPDLPSVQSAPAPPVQPVVLHMSPSYPANILYLTLPTTWCNPEAPACLAIPAGASDSFSLHFEGGPGTLTFSCDGGRGSFTRQMPSNEGTFAGSCEWSRAGTYRVTAVYTTDDGRTASDAWPLEVRNDPRR